MEHTIILHSFINDTTRASMFVVPVTAQCCRPPTTMLNCYCYGGRRCKFYTTAACYLHIKRTLMITQTVGRHGPYGGIVNLQVGSQFVA